MPAISIFIFSQQSMLIFIRYAFSRAVCSSTTMKERPLSPLSPHPWTSYSQPQHRQTETSSAISPGDTCIPIGCRILGYWPIACKVYCTDTTHSDGNLFCNITRWDVHSYWLSQLWVLSNSIKSIQPQHRQMETSSAISPGERCIPIGCRSFGYCPIASKVYSHNTGRCKPLLQFHQVRRAFLLAVAALATGQEHARYTASTQADGNLFCNFTRWDVNSYWLSKLWVLFNSMKGYSYNTGRRKPLLQFQQVRRAFLLAVAALATVQ